MTTPYQAIPDAGEARTPHATSVIATLIKRLISDVTDDIAEGKGIDASIARHSETWEAALFDAKLPIALDTAIDGWNVAGIVIGKTRYIDAMVKRIDFPGIRFGGDELTANVLTPDVGDWVAQTSRIETQTTSEIMADIYRRIARDADSSLGELAVQFLRESMARTDSRALLMARTMTNWAANEGAMQLYASEGIGETEWIVTPDDLLCEYCATMQGVVVKTGERFYMEGGSLMGLEGGSLTIPFDVSHPPLHPHCRCTIAGFDLI